MDNKFNGIGISPGTVPSTALEPDAITDVSASNPQLKVAQHLTLNRRVMVGAATQSLSSGQQIVQTLSQLILDFDGASINFADGSVYENDDTTPLGINFVMPAITNGKYRWFSLTLIPKAVDMARNVMGGQIFVIAGSAEGNTPDLATRPPFTVGIPLALVLVKGNTGDISGIDPILDANIYRMVIGSGGGGGANDPRHEVPTGAINNTNRIFVLSVAPVSQAHTLVFIDGELIMNSKWALADDTITFNVGEQPDIGQTLDVFFFPDPLAVVGGGGGGSGVDLNVISTNPAPDTDGGRTLGTDTKGWFEVILKDQNTSNKWRLQVVDGTLQIVLVV